MDENKRVALYCRYSTHNQDGNYSIDIQLERMKAMCASKGWTLGDEFIDAAYSGANMERPALQELLTRLKEYDVVMVYRLDRLSRSQRDTMTLIQDHFLKNDVAFVSVMETLDTTTPFGMAMIGILAVFAELERATITERMQGGIQKRVEAGYRQLGGDKMPTGYKKGLDADGKGILLVDEESSIWVQRVFDLYEKYHSVTAVQRELKKEGYRFRKFSTVLRVLRNPLYIGKIQYKDKVYDGVQEPIISLDQFERVQKSVNRIRGANAGRIKESLFGGLVHCSCGELYTTYKYRIKSANCDYYVQSYVCRNKRFRHEYDYRCENRNIKNSYLEEVFLNEFERVFINNDLKNKNTEVKTPKKNYSVVIKRIDEKINRLIDLYEDGEIDKESLNKRLEQRKREKEILLIDFEEQRHREENKQEFEAIKDAVLNFNNLEFERKRYIVEQLIERIEIHEDEIIFHWHL